MRVMGYNPLPTQTSLGVKNTCKAYAFSSFYLIFRPSVSIIYCIEITQIRLKFPDRPAMIMCAVRLMMWVGLILASDTFLLNELGKKLNLKGIP